MASIYHFTNSLMHRFRGQVSASVGEDGQCSAPRSLAERKSRGPLAEASRQRFSPVSWAPGKRAPLAAVHCVNAQAAASTEEVSETSGACDRLAALSLRTPAPRPRAPQVPQIVIHLAPEPSSTALEVLPKRSSQVRSLTPPSSAEGGAAVRRRTLRPSRPAYPSTQFTLPQAREHAFLSMTAQKLRLGMSRSQIAGTPEALLVAMAQVEHSAGRDIELTPGARDRLVTLLLYLGEVVHGLAGVSHAEVLRHIEELCVPSV